jgi:hypothetical protein
MLFFLIEAGTIPLALSLVDELTIVVYIPEDQSLRNVRTPPGRITAVFTLKLKPTYPKGNLKPDMPADVSFKIH